MVSRRIDDRGGLVPASRSVPVMAETSEMRVSVVNPYAVDGRGSGNNRNGSYPKTITTEIGQVGVQMPCDGWARSNRQRCPKHVRRLDGLSATSSRSMREG
jgi:hypothetical protein